MGNSHFLQICIKMTCEVPISQLISEHFHLTTATYMKTVWLIIVDKNSEKNQVFIVSV